MVSKYKPAGDQGKAIARITKDFQQGDKEVVLEGATGTGKTFTMANVIAKLNKPTLVISHNKTLAGQLYGEFKEFFPHNRVEYFVSYYDYYQPEAYVPSSDTYIEKDASINDEIDKLRHSATSALLERNDVIVVASVSCIFGLGDPKEYAKSVISLRQGMQIDRNTLLRELVGIQFERNDIDFQRGRFRVRGDVVEIFPASNDENAIRVEFFGDEIDRIVEVDALTGEIIGTRDQVSIFPATHFMTNDEQMEGAIKRIQTELQGQLKNFREHGKLLEAQRLEQRTNYDIDMMREMGYTNGIENYSATLEGRAPGVPPHTLLDFFPDDFNIMIDESHVTMPQIRGMYNGDRARKQMLVDYGFRLPSARDNRPLKLNEFEEHVKRILYVSATPGPYEMDRTQDHVPQIIRPTGLLDPIIEVRPIMGQIDDMVGEINQRVEKHERVFITTMTKKMAEDLTDYLKEMGMKVRYLHSDIKTLERTQIIRDLRLGVFDVLIGINLLREGIDVPEVSLICILDADKEGFLRSAQSLTQIIGRASRNVNGKVIMYADKVTDSMQEAIAKTRGRRKVQEAFNEAHDVTPTTIVKPIRDAISVMRPADDADEATKEKAASVDLSTMTKKERTELINNLTEQMQNAAKKLDFETAATLRDTILELKAEVD
ncbi:excinuclease ABC subunit B [Schleiferilactobacillus harbinensis DSM 16991]|uniref:UvrABC system protein B n=1 Tax=Schleiferilactobacillus harbinensis DSM 16991 TaxID=1122147 RepID=A0A0R1XGX4_9LACO|nr:excinuclease ABC subunit B [Schleiferilactobacillus harbinensis DSM 16991]